MDHSTTHDSDMSAGLFSDEPNNSTTTADQHNTVAAGFSLVVDDVDGELDDPFMSESEEGGSRLEETSEQEENQENTPEEKEKSDARIQQIKGEAEIRKNQFAQLLEEHAQIMQRIKQMEEGPGSLQGGEVGPTEV